MKLFSGHFRGLLSFSGRENREPFWLWMLITYVAQTVVSTIASVPMFVWMFQRIGHAVAVHDREQLRDQQAMFHDMMPLMIWAGVVGVILSVLFIIFVGAAVVRRLHDGNRSGWRAAPVALLNVISQVSSLMMLVQGKLMPIPGKPFAATQQSFGLIQFAALLAIVILIVVLVLPGTDGDNRFGSDPLLQYRRR
jgi:uncharacterized membrane protein YhaH (DUF805 family)